MNAAHDDGLVFYSYYSIMILLIRQKIKIKKLKKKKKTNWGKRREETTETLRWLEAGRGEEAESRRGWSYDTANHSISWWSRVGLVWAGLAVWTWWGPVHGWITLNGFWLPTVNSSSLMYSVIRDFATSVWVPKQNF